MKRRLRKSTTTLAGLSLAYIAGMMGSFTADLFRPGHVQAAPAQVVRANRFELVDGSGTPRAFLEFEGTDRPRLRISSGGSAEEVTIGVTGRGQGYLALKGVDGRPRFAVHMGYQDKPMLLMGDEESGSKVVLGSVQPDAMDPTLDIWALEFSRAMPHAILGGLFMETGQNGKPSKGSLLVRDASGKSWSLPTEGR
jgi:hypothetical protein